MACIELHNSCVGAEEVGAFLASRFIDERTAEALRDMTRLRARVVELEQHERKLNEERQLLFKDQERIRANIESLKSGPTQRGLSERFVTKLNEQEDRLEAIAKELEGLSRERQQVQAEVSRKLQGLSFTAELGAPLGRQA